MIIIGIHRGHGASCAIMINGEIVYASLEERFSKTKNDIGFPYEALKYGLEKFSIDPKKVNKVVYTTKYFPSIFTKSKHRILYTQEDYIRYYMSEDNRESEQYFTFLKYLRDDQRFNKHKTYYNFEFLTDEVLKNPAKERELWTKEQHDFLIREFGFKSESINFYDHHTCHAYYAYFASKILSKNTAIITLDGGGDGRNQTVWLANDKGIKFIIDSKTANLAKIYKYTTLLLGLRPDEDEHKVMGLAPYAKPEAAQKLQSVFEHLIKVEGIQILENNKEVNILKYLQNSLQFVKFDTVAGAVQMFTENILLKLITNICEELNVDSVVFSGGVALNIKANKMISELNFIKEFFVPASPGDETLSIGACYVANNGGLPLKNMYLGYEEIISEDTFEELKNKYEISYSVSNQKIAELLNSGEIIARISGKAEFGARALGNRSILSHPGKTGIKDKINRSVKKRDFWMPFALSILSEKKDVLVFDRPNVNGKFMTIGFDSKPDVFEKINQGIHSYDYTTRPQFVSKDDNLDYYNIIYAFSEISGIPALLNTSFNLHRLPICNDLNDAIYCFENSQLNYLLVGKNLLKKKDTIYGKRT